MKHCAAALCAAALLCIARASSASSDSLPVAVAHDAHTVNVSAGATEVSLALSPAFRMQIFSTPAATGGGGGGGKALRLQSDSLAVSTWDG